MPLANSTQVILAITRRLPAAGEHSYNDVILKRQVILLRARRTRTVSEEAPVHPWPPIGENIARLRTVSGLTQEGLAERTEVSVDLIRRLEQGNRKTALIGSLYKIANGLDVPLSVLLFQQPVFSAEDATDRLADGGRIDHLRQVIQPVVADLASAFTPEAWTLPDLQRASRDAWRLYQTGGIADLAALLPGFIVSGQQLVRDTHDHERDQALVETSQLYNVASAVLTELGYEDLGYDAAKEALAIAQHADHALVSLWATNALQFVLQRQGRLAEAEARFGQAAPAQLAAWGHVLRMGSVVAVRQQRHSRAEDLLNLAQAAAHRVGSDQVDDYGIWYGPTTVGFVAVALAVEHGAYGQALTLAEAVGNQDGLATRTRMVHLLYVANAQAHEGRVHDAVDTLLAVHRRVPEWLHYQVRARETVGMLLDTRGVSRSRSEGLRELATFLNVQV
jgi:transcriptional regulator with XRE-family HTH domain